jgi:hypothetical protein
LKHYETSSQHNLPRKPDEIYPYIISTDDSSKAVDEILWQRDEQEHFNIVSTASRVLSPAEQSYTICEQELLAIVYALDKFRLYIYESKITLCTESKALCFVKSCAVTSNSVARWLIAIEEYDIEIEHVKGTESNLVDVFTRHPAGLSTSDIQNLSKPNSILVSKIDLEIDRTVSTGLKNLAAKEDTDHKISNIKEMMAVYASDNKRRMEGDVLFRKDETGAIIWKPELPECLERPFIKYVHTSVGHLGVNKCIQEIKY